MSERRLPHTWATAPLSSVAEVVQGASPPGSSYNSLGDGMPFFQGKAEFGALHPVVTKWSTEPSKIAEPGDVLISIRAPVGPTNIADQRCCIGRGLAAIRPFDEVHSRFLLYYLRHSDSLLARQATGSTFQAISGDVLRNHPVVVPPSGEQQRIIDAVESSFTRLDDATATLERVQRNLKRYRASVLRAAVEGRLVRTEAELARAEGRSYEPASVLLERILVERRRKWEDAELAKLTAQGRVPKDEKWKARYVEPVAPTASELPELPEGWCWALLPQLGELNRGKSRHRPRNDPRLLGGPYPFIQTSDVRYSNGLITEYSSSYSEFGLAQSRLWPAGTLCITIAANIAETGILAFDACFPDSVVGFQSNGHVDRIRFIELFLRTAKQDLERYAPATAQKNINLEVLSAVAVPLPPQAEQARIVAEVDRLFSVAFCAGEAAMKSTLRCRSLRQSILKWAFEGRLVDQDPNNEPASVLLERINAERQAKAAKSSRVKKSRTGNSAAANAP